MNNDNLNKEIIKWGCTYLSSHNYTLKSNQPENVLNTPWSYVVRFETSDGYIYLKHTPALFALEPTIIQILQEQFHASVPIVIARNTELNCFLMKDAGKPLREILKQKFDEALLCRAIDQFTSLQMAVADRVDVFLDIGVPDYRLDKLSGLYNELISQKDLLEAEGLTEVEISKLESLLPSVSNLCKKLSDFSIKQTIVQPDFNDNNTLIDDASKKITIIDLGEIVISHPFFSLLNCLEQIKKHHGLTDKDDTYQRIKDTCFKNYMHFFESKEHFLDAFTTAQLLSGVYGISYQYRFMIACGKEQLISFQHWRLSNLLKEFMSNMDCDCR
ncbi:TPA: aminoglycoside phosphotransferase family protein [Legionella pneumophila]|nr:aminoglycoside phosphotransferase family protein [Legionella pneumophila]HDO7949108.1 aminoglycoside phosphotransferase family protein [Legionella pneumophila]HDO7952018.1 aminoglycoside phosphotransferase family protein [Legionella pneumophila]HDO8179400.1 aminoglycoside phosphotransferase family protein [Legionella pneumophila]HDO8338091.1 aminoglycoside phosphotransferase family protein [Legionella pneumophila]